MKNKLGYVVIVLSLTQIAVILLSWLITAANPDWALHSLLSSEGIRWFFGSFVSNQLTSWLVYLMVESIAVGAFVRTKFLKALQRRLSRQQRQRFPLTYPERIGLRIALVEFIAFIVVMVLLTLVPHAILLSVTGQLYPSSFSASLIPALSFILLVMSLSYGIASKTINSITTMHDMLTYGLLLSSRYVPTYVLAIQLYMSLKYVFQ